MLLLIERLLLFAAWSAVAYAVAAYAAHATRRRGLYIPLFLILFLAPAWDVVPGLVAYNAADASVGGMHIYRPGVAEGYLDRRVHTALAGWTELSLSSFNYIEIQSDSQPFTGKRDPGYYELRFALEGSSECRRSAAIAGEPSVSATIAKKGFCPTYAKHAAPISRYSVDSSHGWQPVATRWWSRPVEEKWVRVRDEQLGVDLCTNYIVRYRPWLAALGFTPVVPDLPPDVEPQDDPGVDLEFILEPTPR